MPLSRPVEPVRRGPFWYLGFARMAQAERAPAIRDAFFGKAPAEINEAAFDLVRHAAAAGNWDALADALADVLPEMRRMMGASA